MELRDKSSIIHKGGLHKDQRGILTYFNDFDLEGFHRFYIIEPANPQIIRAWQAHKVECKAFLVIEGSFELAWVEINDFQNPSSNLVAESMLLSANEPRLKIIPGGYANGFRALSANAKILVFSDRSVDASLDDDYRYEANLWHHWGTRD